MTAEQRRAIQRATLRDVMDVIRAWEATSHPAQVKLDRIAATVAAALRHAGG